MGKECFVLLEGDCIEPRSCEYRLWCVFIARMPLRQQSSLESSLYIPKDPHRGKLEATSSST